MRPTLPPEIAAALVEAKSYSEWDALHRHFTWARANMPLAVAENQTFDPFWAVTRHADILEVSRNNARFANGIRQTTLTDKAGVALAAEASPKGDGHLIRSLVQMDAPDHMKYRLLTQSWFMPKNLKIVEDRIKSRLHHLEAVTQS